MTKFALMDTIKTMTHKLANNALIRIARNVSADSLRLAMDAKTTRILQEVAATIHVLQDIIKP